MTKMSKTRFEKKMRQRHLRGTMRSGPKLWSIPTPKHNLSSIDGKVRLYHYTPMGRLGSIMTHGLIKGDVMGNIYGTRNWNAPNLTSESEYHNPANRDVTRDVEKGYVRLEIYFEETDENIIPYGWFDRTYCDGVNRRTIEGSNADGNRNGDIDKQYLYKGPISPKMIKKISVWNKNTGYWDRLSKTQILDLIKEYSLPKLSYLGEDYINFDWLRMCGHSLNDWTGKVKEYYEKTDEYEVMSPLYKLTDFINNRLKGDKLGKYKMELQDMVLKGEWEDAFSYVIQTYNKLSKNPVGEEWVQNLHRRQNTWYECYEGNIHYVKKVA